MSDYATPVQVNYGTNSSANKSYLRWEYQTPAEMAGTRSGELTDQEYVGPAPHDPDQDNPPGLPIISPGLKQFITSGETGDSGRNGFNPSN